MIFFHDHLIELKDEYADRLFAYGEEHGIYIPDEIYDRLDSIVDDCIDEKITEEKCKEELERLLKEVEDGS